MLQTLWLLWALLLPVGAAAQDKRGTSHDHVVIILDGSGSMEGRFGGVSKMDGAKQALKAVLGDTPEDTRVGLLVFGRDPGWAYPLGPVDREELFRRINGVQSGGGTPLGSYMKLGADALLEAREAAHGYGTYRLLVVTDGAAGDPKLVHRYTPDILARGVTLDVIGVQMDSDHTLKGQAHTYRSADDPTALEAAVSAVFAEVSTAGDDQIGADAFEVLEGLPDEFAVAAIRALAESPGQNHPIGEAPPTRPVPGADPAKTAPEPAVERRPAPTNSCAVGGPIRGSLAGWLLIAALLRTREGTSG